MPVLRLSFGNVELKEVQLGSDPVTIGRSPQGDLFIDNPAVSFHHARVYSEAGVYYVQDLGSLNGTFLNGIRITQAPLTQGDVITIGKHTVRFAKERAGATPPAAAPAAEPHSEVNDGALKLTGTMVLDTKMRRELQERLARGQAAASSQQAAHLGKLTLLKGKALATEFLLTSNTSMIGKSGQCAVRLKGWFAPKLAAMIVKQGAAYQISSAGRTILVNGAPLASKADLKEGDVVGVGKWQFRFNLVAW
jgi:pSer/pThr/pTyr-binding forkhead associated (FHA) protein